VIPNGMKKDRVYYNSRCPVKGCDNKSHKARGRSVAKADSKGGACDVIGEKKNKKSKSGSKGGSEGKIQPVSPLGAENWHTLLGNAPM